MSGEARQRDWGVRITLLIFVLLAGGAIAAFVAVSDAPLPTSGPSMGHTLGRYDDPIDVDEDAFEHATPRVGQIVVAQAPAGVRRERCGVKRPRGGACPQAAADYSTTRVVKRIVGAPGDTIAFTATGYVIRNGRRVREPYVLPCRGRTCWLPRAVTVPDGHWFLAGDNRPVSSDSRFWGAVTTDALDGLVTTPQHLPLGKAR